jgi:hypothetical protein
LIEDRSFDRNQLRTRVWQRGQLERVSAAAAIRRSGPAAARRENQLTGNTGRDVATRDGRRFISSAGKDLDPAMSDEPPPVCGAELKALVGAGFDRASQSGEEMFKTGYRPHLGGAQ